MVYPFLCINMAFGRLRQLLDFIINLDENKIVFDILQKRSALEVEILNLNRIDQLFKRGIDSEGRLIGVYSFRTEEISGGRKRAGTHITLFDTGQFYKSFAILPFEDFFRITANPIREDTNLFEDFGEDIVGLTEENKAKLPDLIRPRIIQYIKERLP